MTKNTTNNTVVSPAPVAKQMPRPKRGLEEELVDQELFIYDSTSDAVYCFNNGAAIVWYLCDGRRDSSAIAAEIAASFAVPLPQAQQEVAGALTRFDELGLLVHVIPNNVRNLQARQEDMPS